LSEAEKTAIAKEIEYMERGPGRIERILKEEMGKLYENMDGKIKQQDEEFLAKVHPPKK